MLPKHVWSVICRRAIVDSQTNNITLSEVLEELAINIKVEEKNIDKLKIINVPIEFDLVSYWKKEEPLDKDLLADCEVEIINPEGKVMKKHYQKVNLPPNMTRLRTILRVMGLDVENPGDYVLRVKVKDPSKALYETVSELPLLVKLKKEIVSGQKN